MKKTYVKILIVLLVGALGVLEANAKNTKKDAKKNSQGRKPAEQMSHETDKMTIIAVDPDMELEGFDPKEYNVYAKPKPQPSQVPAPAQRDRIFARAGISVKELGAYDQMAKDMLYLRAKNYAEKELITKYPYIAVPKLLKLKMLAK